MQISKFKYFFLILFTLLISNITYAFDKNSVIRVDLNLQNKVSFFSVDINKKRWGILYNSVTFFKDNTMIVPVIALTYPHLIYILSRPFRRRRAYITRQFLIHGDALWCGLFLGYINFPMELVVLFLIMINNID